MGSAVGKMSLNKVSFISLPKTLLKKVCNGNLEFVPSFCLFAFIAETEVEFYEVWYMQKMVNSGFSTLIK